MAETVKKKTAKATMTGLLDIMSPPSLHFSPKNIMLGESFASIIVITAYPGEIDDVWLSRYVSLPGVTMTMHNVPTEPFNLVNSIRLTMGKPNPAWKREIASLGIGQKNSLTIPPCFSKNWKRINKRFLTL